MISNNFITRHIGPRKKEEQEMLNKIGVNTLEQLIDETIPKSIRLKQDLNLKEGLNEFEYLNLIKEIGNKNKLFNTYIGLGYYNTITPGVIQRNVLENPGWYTSYTPYQAEISQGRLEALLNFQTMISSLTAMPISNCSLLDEGTSAAEAMILAFNARSRKAKKAGANKFFVSEKVFPQTIAVMQTRANPLGIEVIVGNEKTIEIDETFIGALVQYPDADGAINHYSELVEKIHSIGALFVVAADILSLTMLKAPGEWGADIVVGSSQRFGVPMGYGGPHAGFLAAKENLKRNIPGRIIGISKDAQGNPALRMALQTREQHIKRERATSNICTAQALLAIMAGFYAAYHGPEGLKNIARNINILTGVLNDEMKQYGYEQENAFFFDTLKVKIPASVKIEELREIALQNEINFRYFDEKYIGISIDETTSLVNINAILSVLAKANNKQHTDFVCNNNCDKINTIDKESIRTSEFLTQEVFNKYHSETEMMRYMKRLENRDLALNRTMIPLGSCTMKLNAGAQMFSLSWPEFGALHPFVPMDQAEGYQYLIKDLEKDLCEITGFDAMTFQPNSGAAGEYAGLMSIRQYHLSQGNDHRNVCLIPSSAHGTNPASAAMAGMKVVIVKCDERGNIDINNLRELAEEHANDLAAIMVTYPSTHGVFEESILELVKIVHDNGGQVYMDGANMNAQVGFTNPGFIGADVCHLNLHKTFAIPHGGGGPGVGPIGVKKHLAPFLPSNPIVKIGDERAIKAVASSTFGSPLVLPITYGYIKMLGGEGLKMATSYAILNANYLKDTLKETYKILYTGTNNHCAHEFILDCNEYLHSANVSVGEIGKRLQDFGIHAPTIAFPVHGTLMVEPTESESIEEMDRFAQAMIQIREEIKEIEEGKADKDNNVIKNAPHTCEMTSLDEWNFPYTRQKAAFPVDCDIMDKYWPAVTKVDDGYGDRNLTCTCEPIKNYIED